MLRTLGNVVMTGSLIAACIIWAAAYPHEAAAGGTGLAVAFLGGAAGWVLHALA